MFAAVRSVLTRTLDPHAGDTPTDAELVGRFRDDRDEDAFAILVVRHGPMVFGVCRRMLPGWQDAEDAFQATFLVLACKPHEVRPPDRVGAWLHGVACRAALKARRTAARRNQTERIAAHRPEAERPSRSPEIDLPSILDDVLLGLPEKYRLPVVECHLAGRSRRDAAARLGCSEGTLSGRLARALELLAARLTRRGVELPVVALTGVLSAQSLPAAVPANLAASTVSVASQMLGGAPVPAGLAALARGVLNVMWWKKLKAVAAVGLMIGVVCAGFGLNQATADPAAGTGSRVGVSHVQPKAGAGWRLLRTWERQAPITVLAWGPDRVMFGDEGGGLAYRDVRTGEAAFDVKKRLGMLKEENDEAARPITSVAIQPDDIGAQIVIGRTLILHMDTRNDGFLFRAAGGKDWNAFGASPDGAVWVASLGKAAELQFPINNLKGKEAFGEVEGDVDHTKDFTLALFAPDNETLAVFTHDPKADTHFAGIADRRRQAVLWEVELGKKVRPRSAAFAPDSATAFVGGSDGIVRRFAVKDGKAGAEIKAHAGAVLAIGVSPDGKLLVTGGADKTVKVWEAATGKLLTTLTGHTDPVRCVAFSRAGDMIASGSADKTVRVWEYKK